MTSSAMMAVIVLTWLFGVLAVNHTEDKIYHYIFIVFYTFQVSRLLVKRRLLRLGGEGKGGRTLKKVLRSL